MAWRFGHEDPYRLYNGLDEAFRPYGGGDPRPPPHPWRYRMFLYGCASHASKEDVERTTAMAGGSVARSLGGRK